MKPTQIVCYQTALPVSPTDRVFVATRCDSQGVFVLCSEAISQIADSEKVANPLTVHERGVDIHEGLISTDGGVTKGKYLFSIFPGMVTKYLPNVGLMFGISPEHPRQPDLYQKVPRYA